VYSIAPFATYRCLEQIRNDVCLHELPVRIVGNGGGYSYGIMGPSHHALEDLAVLKVLPNMQLFFPCANDHVARAVALMGELRGPSYLRLSVSAYNTDRAPLTEHPLSLTRSYAVRRDPSKPGVTVIGAGHGVQVALRALVAHGLERENVDVFGIARFPFRLAEDSTLMDSVCSTKNVVFVEEHYAAGGMGESMKFALPPLAAFSLMCASYRPDQRYGGAEFHMKQSQLTPEALVALVRARLGAS
jgi:transketolase